MGDVLLQATGLTKRYGHVDALSGVDFAAFRGEVVALVGDNGAGKSTLVKILSGSIQADSGEILVDGKSVNLTSSAAARRHGIETVYQDLALAGELNPAANVFLGMEHHRQGLLGKLGFLDKKRMQEDIGELFASLSVKVDVRTKAVSRLSGGQQQGIAVARAVMWASKVILLDEPTAALGVIQTRNVLDVIRRVRDRGLAVVLISHSMPDVLAVADRIDVLRLGRRVAQFAAKEATTDDLVSAMTGSLEVSEG
jgi:simple sugar transport system ATP-binding protein